MKNDRFKTFKFKNYGIIAIDYIGEIMNKDNKLIVFEDKRIRRAWFKEEWYFSVVDIISALTESANPTDYLKKIRKRDEELGNYIGTNCPQVEMVTESGKKRLTLAGNIKDIFRVIQSVPSKRAEPFKLWLAKLGQERIEEIENPELAQDRVKEYYELKGYPKDWIDKRLRGIAIRQNLTDEWKKRGIEERRDFAILTNEIHQATFDIPIQKHKELKNLPKQSKANLRDHMTDLELIFTMLGERATTEITQVQDANGFNQLKTASKKGGTIAKNARTELEVETGRKVLSKENHLMKKKKLIRLDGDKND